MRGAFDALPAPVNPTTEIASTIAPPPSTEWKALWEAAGPLEGSPGEAYLWKRGIPLEVAQLAGVRWSSNWSGKGSVVFPIQAMGREIVAAQGRAIHGSAKITQRPKKSGAFFAPVKMGNDRICGPFDHAVPAVVLVEAPIDALSLATCGFPALALCGTSGPGWLHIASGLRKVVLAFDADDAGDKAAEETIKRLSPYGCSCTRLHSNGFKDWNEYLVGQGRAQLNDWLAGRLLLI